MSSGSARTVSFRDRVLELIAVIFLGVTTVGTAWCSYQASAWNTEQGDLARQSSDARIEASRLFGLNTQQLAYDSMTLSQYAQAAQDGNERLLEFYRRVLIRPDFLPVLQAWEAQVKAGETPPNIFEDTSYKSDLFASYTATAAKADAFTAASEQAGETADAYLVTTILLAVGLFFAGITSSFSWWPARALLLLLALATIAVAATRLVGLTIA